MKKNLILILFVIASNSLFSQAKKPTLMVLPADVWCKEHNYWQTFDNQGTKIGIPNYKEAVQSDQDLLLVIGKINTMFSDRGFSLKNLESVMKDLEQQSAEDAMTSSTKSGASLAENPLDKLFKRAKADIIIQVTWKINQTGPKKSITFNLQGIDAYTGKQIAGAQGTGQPSFSSELPILLEEAVLSHVDNFTNQLQQHFSDLLANGREVSVKVNVFNNGSGITLETEYGGKELTEVINDWMEKNTVSGRFSKSDATETFISFEQVRIPLYDENQKAMDTEKFVRKLMKYLKEPPYSLTCKVISKGLGRTQLIIGEK
ncbi:MAG: DUF6175 family protein [Bacteroidia bacterium]